MAIYVRDEFLEGEVERVRVTRGDATVTKTAKDLLRERLTALGVLNGDAHSTTPPALIPASAPATEGNCRPQANHRGTESTEGAQRGAGGA